MISEQLLTSVIRAMNEELKKREQGREAKKAAARRKFKEMGRKWEENEQLVRALCQYGNTADCVLRNLRQRIRRTSSTR